MDSISELVNYCKIDDPAGALLLTGEWGCGKTYLVENELKKHLEDTHIIIRVSLFGVSSIDEVHKAVKEAWIYSNGGLLETMSGLKKYKDLIKNFSNLLPSSKAQKTIDSVLSVSFFDFVKVKRRIQDKKVVLVFDDLERCDLGLAEKLGIINEYCENQGFNVIIIADESKMDSNQYKEYKEKVIQRTLHHIPNYTTIVESIIKRIPREEYREILQKKQVAIAALFAGMDENGNYIQYKSKSENEPSGKDDKLEGKQSSVKKHSHNIRSLKVAIQDFERIFDILSTNEAEDIDKWFLSFLALTMVSKGGVVNWDQEYGLLFENNELSNLYPGYYDERFMPNPVGAWIVLGEWNENAICDSIKQLCEKKNKSAMELVRSSRIDYFEEDVAIEGMKNVIPLAYKGELSLNEYVIFIINAKLIRDYNLSSIEIDWGKVKNGIKVRVEENINNREIWEPYKEGIKELDGFSEEEKNAYKIIADSRSSMYAMFEANRREYIRLFSEEPTDALMIVLNRRYNCFDNEMALATARGFEKVDIPTKGLFPEYFERLWKNYNNSMDIDDEGVKRSIEGFISLNEHLQILAEKYSDEPFKKRYTSAFIIIVDKLLKQSN